MPAGALLAKPTLFAESVDASGRSGGSPERGNCPARSQRVVADIYAHLSAHDVHAVRRFKRLFLTVRWPDSANDFASSLSNSSSTPGGH